jgi:hypothetical protein
MSGRLRARRLAGLVVAAATCSFSAPAAAHAAAPMWSIATVMSRIDGAKVVVGRWSSRVKAETTLCSGEGRSARWRGVRHWRRFTCTWTVFDRRGLVDRDVTFRVVTLDRTHCRITDARFGAS